MFSEALYMVDRITEPHIRQGFTTEVKKEMEKFSPTTTQKLKL